MVIVVDHVGLDNRVATLEAGVVHSVVDATTSAVEGRALARRRGARQERVE